MSESTESAMTLMQTRLSLLERKIDFLFKALNLTYTQEIPAQMRPVAELLRQGRREEAIDAYCEATGGGLAEAKAAISELQMLLRGT